MQFEGVLVFVLLVLYLFAAAIKALFRLVTGAAQKEREEEQRREDERRRWEDEREREEAAERKRQRTEERARQKAATGRQSPAESNGAVTQADAYELLGVSQGCTPEELARAYHRKVSEWHPDKLDTMAHELRDYATRRTARINEAYDRLRSGLVQRRVPGE